MFVVIAASASWEATALGRGSRVSRHPRVTVSVLAGTGPDGATGDVLSAIYCNRALNMEKIQAVGFDMDYTLAEYIPETFDLLAFNGALTKLIHDLGYPPEIRSFRYDPHRYQRGLLMDKKRGNILKLDRHKYVKVAYHGLTKLSSAERKAVYDESYERESGFTPPEYAMVDTAFMLVDVHLFCQLVDFKDAHPGALEQSYAQIAKDVRRAVDLCHCDGVIKDLVAAQPARYVAPSPRLAQMLGQLRASGKQVFLLTNSLYDYTEVVCRFLLGERWLDHFDLVICGGRKPGFLLDPCVPESNTVPLLLSNPAL